MARGRSLHIYQVLKEQNQTPKGNKTKTEQ
ncbi:hypothetical protein CCACVL1_26391 [Corchorus capsularis]|uniref:Uncharacterized protein n=1 Tax=Corchorus capsularis TaxID=210143 RepID=A0A1R3GEZ4_COCAP|nr:hypothetical protein CCACVL1_26391 [Corchorus capsularis]